MDKIHFLKYQEIYGTAIRLFIEEEKRIHSFFPSINIEHVGGTSIPNSITLGDLDIQIRVIQKDFLKVCKKLKTLYHENKPELWTDQFALFHWKDHPIIPMSIVLTVIDSPFDDFSKIRDLFKSDKNMLKKYNNLKKKYEGKTLEEYKTAKSHFFGNNGKNNILQSLS